MYDSMNGGSGWWQVGGTSAGAPQWAALVAIANEGRAVTGTTTADRAPLDGPSQTLYAVYKEAQSSYTSYFHDVTTGNNGFSAGAKYDFVTGLGSPIANKVVGSLIGWKGSGSTGTLDKSTSVAAPGGGSAKALVGGLVAMDAPPSMQALITQVGSTGALQASGLAVAPLAASAPDFIAAFTFAPFGNSIAAQVQLLAPTESLMTRTSPSANSNGQSAETSSIPLPRMAELSTSRRESDLTFAAPDFSTDRSWDWSFDLEMSVSRREFDADNTSAEEAEVELTDAASGE